MALSRRCWLAWGAAVFAVPFLLYYCYTLNAIYYYGLIAGDGGALSHILWHGDWKLTTPPFYTHESFFCMHLNLFLLLFSRISYVVPWYRIEYYAFLIGALYASLGLALFYAFSFTTRPRNHLHMALLALGSIAFSFSGIVTNGLPYLHFEYGIPLSIILFLISLARRKLVLSVAFLLMTLIFREDAGLHLAGILSLLIAVRYFERRSFAAVKWEIGFLAAAVFYSALAFVAIRYFCAQYGHGAGEFATIYSGTPPYAHLTWELLGTRLKMFFLLRSYIWMPAALTLFVAVRARDAYLTVGYLTNIPWVLLGLTAQYDRAGTIDIYYGFPFMLSLGWPIVAALWRYGPVLPADVARKRQMLQLACVLLSLFMWNLQTNRPAFGPSYGARFGGYVLQPEAAHPEHTREFIDAFDHSEGDLGAMMVQEKALSLVRGAYKGRRVHNLQRGKNAIIPVPTDTLLYVEPPSRGPGELVKYQASQSKLTHHYCIIDSALCLFTNRTPAQLESFMPLLTPVALAPGPVPATR